MRLITKEAMREFRNARPWHKDNTRVELSPSGEVVVLKLHGNAIARYDLGDWSSLEICDGGWSSNTTKERLNGLWGVSISQKEWLWYLNGKRWDGNWITVKDWDKATV
jgi:hypothetical protein